MFNSLIVCPSAKTEGELYIVTDVESKGPIPVDYPMLSFASVAVDISGTVHGLFYANIKSESNQGGHPTTMDWWRGFPQAYAFATYDPLDTRYAFRLYKDWLDKVEPFRCYAVLP